MSLKRRRRHATRLIRSVRRPEEDDERPSRGRRPSAVRLGVPLALLFLAVAIAWTWSRGAERKLSFTAAEVALPEALGALDNAERLRRISARFSASSWIQPCRESGLACELTLVDAQQKAVFSAPGGQVAFRSVSLSGPPVLHARCENSLRFDRRGDEAAALSWFPGDCPARVTFVVPAQEALELANVRVGASVVQALPGAPPPTEVELSMEAGGFAQLEYAIEKGDTRALPLTTNLDGLSVAKLSMVPSSTLTFEHKVGVTDVVAQTCEASPTSTVTFSAGLSGALKLERLALGSNGIDVVISLSGDWVLDTGTCRISAARLEWTLFGVLLASLIVTFTGLLAWARDWW